MRNVLFVLLVTLSESGAAEISLRQPYEFIPPSPEITVETKSNIPRHASYIKKTPFFFGKFCVVPLYQKRPKINLSLQYIGSRETWIPITGEVKKEKFYRVQ